MPPERLARHETTTSKGSPSSAAVSAAWSVTSTKRTAAGARSSQVCASALAPSFIFSDVCKISSSEFGDTYYYSFFDWNIKPENNICYSEFVEIPIKILTTDVYQKNSKEIQFVYQKSKKRIIALNAEKNPISMILLNSSGQLISRVGGEDSFENLVLILGIYLISMEFEDGTRVTKKLVVFD